MEVTDVDVAVIGAGPAGSTLATLLAKSGISCVVVDRDVHPRDKVCGEFLSWDALPILEWMGAASAIESAGARRIRRCRIFGSSRTYEFEFPDEARGISRMQLDSILLKNAAAHGAVRLDGWTALRVERAQDRTALVIEARSGEIREIRARVIAGAWGRWGRFDKQLGRRFVSDTSHRHFGFKRHYRGITADSDSVDLYAFRGGYLGVSAIEQGQTNICGLVRQKRMAGMRGGWKSLVASLAEESAPLRALFAAHEADQDDFLTSEPVVFRAKEPVEGGIVMIGDAAGIIDPLTGNGMAMAVQSALLAACSIREILHRRDRPLIEQQYAGDYRELFQSRLLWSRSAARILSHPQLLDLSLAIAGRSHLGGRILSRTRAGSGAIEILLERWIQGTRHATLEGQA